MIELDRSEYLPQVFPSLFEIVLAFGNFIRM